MKDMSLKYFPRTNKLSSTERMMLSDFNIINKNKIANQRLEAFAIITLLKMAMGNNPDSGFFIKADEKQLSLLASEDLFGIDTKFVKRVLESCFNQGLYDKQLYDKFNILTSLDIQNEYFFSDNVKRRALKDIENYKDYVYDVVWDNLKTASKNTEIASKNEEIASKKKETKQNKTKTQTESETNKPTATTNIDSFGFSLESFKNLLPGKDCKGTIELPEDINLEVLAKKIKESDFLLKANNLDVSWLIKHYKDIMADNYKQFTSTQKTDKIDRNFQKHNYTKDELNSLFDKLDDMNL